MASKRVAYVERKGCVSCGTCLQVCPMQAMEIIKGCYAQVKETICIGCGKCAKACPADCIQIKEREGSHE